tara:strand:- start:1247 stop:2098 length:852 start_codon:yes stop_codon:yes gene_type:complete
MTEQMKCFDVETSDGVATVTMKRPERFNSMIPEFWTELPSLIRKLDSSGEVRAVVLASTGRHFCSGMDLAVFGDGDSATGSKDPGRVGAMTRMNVLHLQETFSVFEKVRMPVIAAIQGGCVGGAVDMVTAADMRYATEDAFFCIQEINIGMTADVGTLQRLPKLIPEGVCRELSYTGRRMPSSEAKSVGLVNEVFSDQETMLDAVHEVAAEIAEKSPLAVWGTKQMINYARDHSTADSLNHIATWNAGMFRSGDMKEAFTAQAEKRNPEFEDLLPYRNGVSEL